MYDKLILNLNELLFYDTHFKQENINFQIIISETIKIIIEKFAEDC